MSIKLCSDCQGKDTSLRILYPSAKAEYGECTKCGFTTMIREMVKVNVAVPKTKSMSMTADSLFRIIDSISEIPPETDMVFIASGTPFADEACIEFFSCSSVLVVTRNGELYKGGVRVDGKH